MKHSNLSIKYLLNQRSVYFLSVVVLLVPNFFLFCTETMSVWTRFAFLLLPASVYMGLLLLSKKPGIPLWCLLPMLVLGAFQLVLLYLFGQSIIATDMFLNLFTTNAGEALELLDKLLPAIVGVCLLYIPLLIIGVYSIRSPQVLPGCFRRRMLRTAAGLFAAGVCFAVIARRQQAEFRLYRDIFPVNIFYNMQLAAVSWDRSVHYLETSRTFDFQARSVHDPAEREIYILVVGETARALNWGLYGYPRPTTPRLQQTPGLVLFTDLLTQSNATHKSVPIILSGASAEDYDCIYRQKGIIAAFRQAGFHTAFFSNQRPNHSFIDYFGEEAEVYDFLKEDTTENYEPYDDVLLRLADQQIARGDRKLLIVLHTYGSHFNYNERYPAADAFFKPDRVDNVDYKIRDQLINAYDNTIRYTDSFLHALISRLDSTGAAAALLYSSDHGEDILDDRRRHFLHASPVPTYYQLHVPCFLWMSDTYGRLYPDTVARAVQNRTAPLTTNMIFHTFLSVGGIETPYRRDTLSIVSQQFLPLARRYLNDHNEPCPLDKVGLKQEDIKMFDKLGLAYP